MRAIRTCVTPCVCLTGTAHAKKYSYYASIVRLTVAHLYGPYGLAMLIVQRLHYHSNLHVHVHVQYVLLPRRAL